jgi:hypothetical protein
MPRDSSLSSAIAIGQAAFPAATIENWQFENACRVPRDNAERTRCAGAML